MLVITQEQIQHFIAKGETELVSVIGDSIRQTNPERVADLDNETFEQMLQTGISQAKSKGLDRAEQIAAFVAIMFEIDTNFAEQKDVKAVLEDTSSPPSARFDLLWERVSEEAWSSAAGSHNVGAEDETSAKERAMSCAEKARITTLDRAVYQAK